MNVKRFAVSVIPALVAAIALGALPQRLKHPYASDAPITEPAIFGEGVISTEDFDDYFAFTRDGNTIYFTKHTVDFSGGTIVVSHFRDGNWTTPEVAPFSGKYGDEQPCISPDGSRLFFTSNRPVTGQTPRRDADIWFVEKTATGWGPPQHLDAPVNTDAYDWHPSVTKDGTLYFVSARKAEKRENNIYSSRSGGAGAMDIYVSARRNGRWEAPRNVGSAINTPAAELWASLSPDGRYLFFNSSRKIGDPAIEQKPLNYQQLIKKLRSPGNGSTDIYRIELSALKLDP